MAQDSPVEEIIGLPRYNVQANKDYSTGYSRSSNLSPVAEAKFDPPFPPGAWPSAGILSRSLWAGIDGGHDQKSR